MIIKVIFISSFILGQHGFVHYAQCIACITLCICTFASHPFHLPCFRLSVPLFLHCISAARTENTVTLFCAEKKKKSNATAPKHLPAKHPSPRAIMIAQKTAFNAALMTRWQRKKRDPPVNNACAVSTSVTICRVLSCSVREPENKRDGKTRDLMWQSCGFILQHLWASPLSA